MKKNGFTLIEVLSIMVVLSVIAVVVFPQVKSSMNNKKQKQLDNIIGIIENAAKTYYNSDENALSKVSIDELISEKYLTSNLINPLTNERITGCVIRSIEDGYFKYEYSSDNVSCKILASGLIVKLDANGGIIPKTVNWSTSNDGSISIREYSNNEEYGNLPVPTKQNNKFLGWYDSNDVEVTESDIISGSTNIELYAKWEEDTPTAYYAWMDSTENALENWTSTETNFTKIMYGTEQAKVFLRKQSNVLSACVNYNGTPLCVPKDLQLGSDADGKWTNAEKQAALDKMKDIFLPTDGWVCTTVSTYADMVWCEIEDVYCRTFSTGLANCYFTSLYLTCNVEDRGAVFCGID